MAKVVRFPTPVPEKFGPQRVVRKKDKAPEKPSQLNLFSSGKVVRLHQLSPFEEALMLDDKGDKYEAKTLYQRAVEEGDSIADAYCNLGILEWVEEQHTRAIDCFTLCLKNDPRHYEAHYNLANLYAEIGNFALAKAHYEISIEIEPTFPNSYFNLGLTLAMNKEYKDAVRVLQDYRKLSPVEEHKQTDDLIRKLQTAL